MCTFFCAVLTIFCASNGAVGFGRDRDHPSLNLMRQFVRSGFKTFNQVQSQGGAGDSSAGIYLIFRVLNPSVQHRNWA